MIRIINVLLLLFTAMPLVFAGVSGPAPIPSPPNWAVTTNATSVCRGQVNYIPVTVTDRGSPYQQGASNLSGATMQSVQLGVANSKSIYSISTVNLGSIKPGYSASANVPMLITGNASSIISPQITLNYFYYSLYSDSETSNITFSTQVCASPLSVEVSPQVVTAGSIQNITINVTNNGKVPLNSISIHFSIPASGGAWLSQQPIQIASLAAGNTILLRKNVFIANNQTDQSVPMNVSVIFYNGTRINQIYQNLVVLAGGLITLSPSSFTISPATPNPDGIFSVSFILTNTGTSGASAVSVTALPPKGFSSFGSNTVFVGSVSADSQTPVTLSMSASNSIAPGTYKIPIRVNYLNNLRYNLSIWANSTVMIVPSTFNSSQALRARSSSSGSGIITLILFILMVAFGWLYYTERKKARKNK